MLKSLACAAALAALAALPVCAEPFRIVVTDTEVPLVPNSVMELAEQEGYFDRAGVEVEFVRVQQTPLAMAALRSGEGEMANVALEAVLQATAQGAGDLRGVMSPNKSLPYLIAGRNDLDAVADLAGKRFGIGRVGSVDHLLSMKVLEAAGGDPTSLELVALGQPQARAQALLAGQIDATTLGIGAFTAVDDDPAMHVLVGVDAYHRAAPILSKLNVVRAETIANRGDEVEAVIEAITLASRDFAADPSRWVAAMREARPDVPEADLRLLADAFAGSWSVDGGISRSELEEAQAWLHEGEDFAGIAPAPLYQWADFTPLEHVLAKVGPAPTSDVSDALSDKPHLSLSGVSLTLGGRPVLEGIDFAAPPGETVVVIGPSGCGKTSLLRLIAGLLRPDRGAVLVKGNPPVPGRAAAVVFQSYRLLPWKTVRGNLAFALPALTESDRAARVSAALARVGLARFADAWPRELSGGMQQRVALARALAAEPDLLLMDEPFAALDAQSRELMQGELLQLTGGPSGPTVVLVTHSVDEALVLADRILLMSPGPGRILEEVPVHFPRPRCQSDLREAPAFARLRRHLWDRLRSMVLSDPHSDFFRGGRDSLG